MRIRREPSILARHLIATILLSVYLLYAQVSTFVTFCDALLPQLVGGARASGEKSPNFVKAGHIATPLQGHMIFISHGRAEHE